ncbi:F-box associated ubiquitination effector family protein, partial [Striga hermonthica]
LRETKNQLVSRYVGGLRASLRDTLNLFRPVSVSDAHQRAILAEIQVAQKVGPTFGSFSRQAGASGAASFQPRPGLAPGGSLGQTASATRASATGGPSQRQGGGGGQPFSAAAARTVAGLRCFGCGEMGHRQSVCPKGASSRALFTEDGGEFDGADGYEGPPVYDTEEAVVEQFVSGDVGTALVLRRTFLTSKGASVATGERNHLFESTCTMGNKICRFIIDSGACENVISQEA